MKLSGLQKYILLECFNSKSGKINRSRLVEFYLKNKSRPKENLLTKIITQSIERLINRELLVGYGVRTTHKWFIREVKLTPKGKREAKKLLGQQMKLPLHNKKVKK